MAQLAHGLQGMISASTTRFSDRVAITFGESAVMIPPFLDAWLMRNDGRLGLQYRAYKVWRWEREPSLRIIAPLCDRRRLSVDVGAHSGTYTDVIRRSSRHCLAIEPNPELAATLRQRFPSRVTVCEAAASDRAGTARLRLLPDNLYLATIEPANPTQWTEEVEVELVRLDDIVTESVGFLKVDVEGHEMSVFRGAERLLATSRPNLLVELEERHRPGLPAEAFAFLAGFGYRGWYLAGREVQPVAMFDAATHQNPVDGNPYVHNFVFSTDETMLNAIRRRLL